MLPSDGQFFCSCFPVDRNGPPAHSEFPLWKPPSGWNQGRGKGSEEGDIEERVNNELWMCLHGEQDEERHHQTKETHSLRQSKSQDGVREELLLQGGVPAERHVERQLMSLQTKDLHNKQVSFCTCFMAECFRSTKTLKHFVQHYWCQSGLVKNQVALTAFQGTNCPIPM